MSAEERFAERLVAQLPVRAAPEGLWTAIEARLGQRPPARGWRLALAGAAAAAVVTAAVLLVRTWTPQGWEVLPIAGAPVVGSQPMRGVARLSPGQWLRTDGNSRARIVVGAIGQVAVEPNTAIRMVAASGREQRLALARGTLRARVSAPPRLFLVDTPAATAVDLGCAYTMHVDDAGRGLLRVTLGWVSLEQNGRESLVPAGAACRMRPGSGPGTPYFEDASPELRLALERFDSEGGGAAAAETVLAQARRRDSLTLWHLLPRVSQEERGRVLDRIVEVAELPPGLDREKALRLDRRALAWLKNELDWDW